MARAFDDGSSQYLIYATGLRSTYPVTFAGWFYIDDLSGIIGLMAMSDEATTNNYVGLIFDGTTGDFIYAQQRSDGFPTATHRAESGVAVSVDTWFHGCAVFPSSASRHIYINGGDKGSETTNDQYPTGVDNTTIGTLKRTSAGFFLSGYGAECGIWNVGLTDAEAAELGTGNSPLAVRPQSLVAYWPLIGNLSPELDFVGGYDMVLMNAPTKAVHPRIYKIPAPWHSDVTPFLRHAPASLRNEHQIALFDDSVNESTVYTVRMPDWYTGNGVDVNIHF